MFFASSRVAQRQEGGFLGDEDVRIGRVAQDEDVEAVGQRPVAATNSYTACTRDDHAIRILVVGRQQQRGRGFRSPAAAHPESMPSASVRRCHQRDQAAERARERQRDPGEQDDEQRKDDGFQYRQPADREHLIHLVGRERP